MNAAVRLVVVVGAARGHQVLGVRQGYAGLLAGDTVELDPAAVEGISRYGGTVLGSARSHAFTTEAGQAKARDQLEKLGLEGLVVIGGNGSLTGAHLLATRQTGCGVVGLPASIDNDVGHTSMAIGVDTAVNTIVEACDRISDTARAHRRAFVVEVMGRQCGFLAMRAGVAAEADGILFREGKGERDAAAWIEEAKAVLHSCFVRHRKKRALIIKAEGVEVSTDQLVSALEEYAKAELDGVDVRPTVLGHVVRGGSPSSLDRMIAQRLAYGAVAALEQGITDEMMGWDLRQSAGRATADPRVRGVPLAEMLEETTRLLDGTSPVVQARIALLQATQRLLSA